MVIELQSQNQLAHHFFSEIRFNQFEKKKNFDKKKKTVVQEGLNDENFFHHVTLF